MEINSPQIPYYFSPPAWPVDPDQYPSIPSSSSSKTPTWVIVGTVSAVAMACFFLYAFIRRREKKIRKKAAAEAVATAKKPEPPPQPKPEDRPPPPPPPPAVPLQLTPNQLSLPSACPSCKHVGGLYSTKYICPWCNYKCEAGVYYQGPVKK